MIFKVTYQENKIEAPRRENTLSLYVEAANKPEARKLIEDNKKYNDRGDVKGLTALGLGILATGLLSVGFVLAF